MQALLDAIAAMPLPQQACRIFHGRGGLHAGCEQWTLDAYPPVWALTSFAPASDAQLAAIGAALQARWAHIGPPGQPLNWVLQWRGEGLRAQAGTPDEAGQGGGRNAQAHARLMGGAVPEPHIVREGPAQFLVHLLRGQNHGLFLDMAAGRDWVRQWASDWATRHNGQGARVLNLFAYTCAFSVAALQGGADHVINVDMARGALATGQRNHALNGLHGRASFWAHDVFHSWGKLTRSGPYALVIADPPSHQKGSFIAARDYPRLLRRLPALLSPGGHALLCLNAPELPPEFLQEQVRQHAPGLQFVQRLPNPPAFADTDDRRALKVLLYTLTSTAEEGVDYEKESKL